MAEANERPNYPEYETVRPGPRSDESAMKIIEDARDKLEKCVENESTERAMMLDDLRFCMLDQWPTDVRNDRENDVENGPRPCLTIDKINQYLVQVSNDMRQGKPGIVVRAQDDKADVQTAKILKGLIRNIEDQSSADIAYAVAGDLIAKIGLGYWRVTTEYVSEDSFDQDLFIRPIYNTFSVYMGPHTLPDGSDAKYAFVLEEMPIEIFQQKYPKAKHDNDDFNLIEKDQLAHWKNDETVTVAEYFCLTRTDDTLYFLADGTTMMKSDYDKWPAAYDQAKPPISRARPSFREQLRWYKMTGVEILEQRDLPGKYIPIIECVGKEGIVDGQRKLWGLVRPAKDSLRMYNYFASTITEKMGLAPKAPFIGAKGQFKGVEDRWKKANRINYAYLEYEPIEINGNALPKPERQGPTPVEAALINQMDRIEHDVQTSLGMFKAAVGEHEPQQSGKAILALQRESDTGTYHFNANLGISIRHTGRVLLDLIPHYYDTRRIVRILGEDGTESTCVLDPDQQQPYKESLGPSGMEQIFNPLLGKYDVTITVGPSYNTKRMEAAATIQEVVKSQPALVPIVGDLLFRALDFPYSDKIAERLQRSLPPHLQDSPQGPIPPHAQAQIDQMAQQLQAAEQAMQEQQQEINQLKSGAEADVARAQMQKEVKLAELSVRSELQEKEFELDRRKVEFTLQLQRWEAIEKARLERDIAEGKLELDTESQAHGQALAEDAQQHEKTLDREEQQMERATKEHELGLKERETKAKEEAAAKAAQKPAAKQPAKT